MGEILRNDQILFQIVSLSNDDGNDIENVTQKVNSR